MSDLQKARAEDAKRQWQELTTPDEREALMFMINRRIGDLRFSLNSGSGTGPGIERMREELAQLETMKTKFEGWA